MEFKNKILMYFEECDKLDGKMYVEWKSMVKYILVHYEFWNIVHGKECRPLEEDKHKDYGCRDNKACTTIILRVKHDIFITIFQIQRRDT